MTIKAMVRGINGRLKIRCCMTGSEKCLARYPLRRHLFLMTSRQARWSGWLATWHPGQRSRVVQRD